MFEFEEGLDNSSVAIINETDEEKRVRIQAAVMHGQRMSEAMHEQPGELEEGARWMKHQEEVYNL